MDYTASHEAMNRDAHTEISMHCIVEHHCGVWSMTVTGESMVARRSEVREP